MAWLAAVAGAIICAAATPAIADPLSGSSLPAQTRWVIHIDADGVRQATPLANLARQRAFEPQRTDMLPKLAVLERVTGMNLPQDLHDVTLFGNSFDQSGVCLRIHATNLDPKIIKSFLQGDPEYQEVAHNDHAIFSWRDRNADRLMYASFAKPDVVVISATSKGVADMLDTLDGKAPGLNADSPLSPPPVEAAVPQPLFWMAAEKIADLPRLQKTESPVLEQMDAASMSVKWVNDRALSEMRVVAKSDKAAQEIQKVAEGAKALADLAGSSEHATARSRLLATMMQNLTTQVDGKTLKGNWPLDVDCIDALLNTVTATPLAAPAAVTTPGGKP